ncbi:MAG TPA: hypothetical protein VEY33_09045 [Gemmatimonadota bacterium]|nr:hypothetical protein [Gemmatimonadota bacterium]
MKIPPILVCLLVGGACLIAACSGETLTTDPAEPVATTGVIQIAVTTAGIDVDPDGYSLLLDGRSAHRVATTGSVALTDVPPGPHVLALEDIELNCSIGDNPQSVSVSIGQTSEASFTAACSGVADSSGITTLDLGGIPGATGWTIARGLSEDGAIAGWAEFPFRLRAFYRSPAGVWIDLNAEAEAALGRSLTSVAWDLSDNHRVVGVTDFNSPAERPVLWQEQGATWKVIPLPVEGPGVPGRGGFAHGINGRGDLIAGRIVVNGPRELPVVWSETTPGQWTLELLPLHGDLFQFGNAEAVNDATPTRITGEIGFLSAVVWTREGEGWSDPIVLPKPGGYGSHGLGINRLGDVAGKLFLCPSSETAVLWRNIGAAWELVDITERVMECGDEPSAVAWDVNDARQVVGDIRYSGQRPFLWHDGRLQLLAAGGVAWKINNANQFVGPGSDYRHAFLWTIQ